MSIPVPDDHHSNTQTVILRHCLDAIELGQATVEDCVNQYPAFTDLGDLLRVAQGVRELPRVPLPHSVKAHMRRRALATYRAYHVERPTPRLRHRLWLRLVLVLSLVVTLLAGGIGLVHAADAALPGDGLYSVKRAMEQVQLWFEGDASRPTLLYHIAQRRLEEITALSVRRRSLEAGVLTDLSQSVTAALKVQSDPTQRAMLVAQTASVLQGAQVRGILSSETKSTVMAAILPGEPETDMVSNPPPTHTTVAPAMTSTAIEPSTVEPSATEIALTATSTPTSSPTLRLKIQPTPRPTLAAPRAIPTNETENNDNTSNSSTSTPDNGVMATDTVGN
jgi:hypothetical protein